MVLLSNRLTSSGSPAGRPLSLLPIVAVAAATAVLILVHTPPSPSSIGPLSPLVRAPLPTRTSARSSSLLHHVGPIAAVAPSQCSPKKKPTATIMRVVEARAGGFGASSDSSTKSPEKVSQDLPIMSTLLPKLGQAKGFGVDPRDYIEQPPFESKTATTIDNLASKLEENFEKRGGYTVSQWREALAGEWQLLFTTSQLYRENRGVTGYSGLPGYGLKGIYQRLVPDEKNEEVDGRAVLMEILSAPFGKAAKNELRGAYKIYSKNDLKKKKQVALDQSFVRGDTGGEVGKDIQGNLLMFNTYITKDNKLRFGRGPQNQLYIYGRVGPDGDGTKGGINEILSRDRLPWDGGSPLFRVF
mmetsp:Transcript_9777/g.24075  ORF Transcript_9777/g.24075 Transcript_9777/m.24075 type:complete len:357 (-) Transcript_9777:179-1249(-)|eukprot:CAMPEP_0114511212 /NCGR_PEP_ID=MMETSP0109-20121206/14227_1 /TAXON_ID=29199 /ORGANISM="Chlorarachnion reptans, Strain CCCM449" /LENGTH=356 /DNA_ID=CAMNT_0001690625 /DNA_START=270 /DNA_END=1340 /DNA_ORIENTATION=-